jgi:hypothetical protein
VLFREKDFLEGNSAGHIFSVNKTLKVLETLRVLNTIYILKRVSSRWNHFTQNHKLNPAKINNER